MKDDADIAADVPELAVAYSEWNDPASVETLHGRATALAEVPDLQDASGLIDLLVFGLRGRRFCMELNDVLQVLPMLAATEVPQTPAWVSGVSYHDGEPIVLVDASKFLGISGPGISDRRYVVVLGGRRSQFGLLVDQCEEVHSVDRDDLIALAMGSGDRTSVIGIATDLGDLVDAKVLVEEMADELMARSA